jgi:hypothetical protein
LHSGGNWNNGSNVSPWYWNGNNNPSNSNHNIGGRLILETETGQGNPPFGKYVSKNRLVVVIVRNPVNVKDDYEKLERIDIGKNRGPGACKTGSM